MQRVAILSKQDKYLIRVFSHNNLIIKQSEAMKSVSTALATRRNEGMCEWIREQCDARVDWIQLTRNSTRRRDFVSTAMKLRAP